MRPAAVMKSVVGEVTRRGVLRAAALLGSAVLASAVFPGATDAQDVGGGAVSPDSADALRRALVRPPAEHPYTLGDVLAFPLRVAAFPAELTVSGIVWLGDAVVGANFEVVNRAYATVRDAGFELDPSPELGPRSGLGLGIRYVGLRPLVLEAGGSLREYQHYRIGVDDAWGRWNASVSGDFRRHASNRFWGVGSGASEDGESDYRRDRVAARAKLGVQASGALRLDVETGWEENSVARGLDEGVPDLQDVFEGDEPFGTGALTRFWWAGVEASVDLLRRDTLRIAGTKGGVRADRYVGVSGTASDFTRVRAWLHGYVPVDGRTTLALRARGELSRGEDAGVPFFHLSTLGGGDGLRSFDWDRFRDRDLLLLTAEWRYELWRDLRERGRAEWFVFWDEGGVAHSLDDLQKTRSSYGFGLDMLWLGRVVAVGYVAFGDEGSRVSLSFSPSF